MHIGIFGMGYWGKNILRNLLKVEEVHKLTIYDPASFHPDSAGLLSDARIHCTTNKSDIVKDPTVEAVFIVTPAETHFQIASNILQNGKHVFIEKPVTTNSNDLKTLINLAEKNEKVLFPSHTYLHTAEIKKLKKLIDDDGLLGKPLLYQSNRSNFGRFRSDKSAAWDLAVHDLYIIKHLFSQTPVSVSATGLKCDDNFPHVMCNISIGYNKGLSASIVANWLSSQKFRDTVIVGTKGSFIYDDCLTKNKLAYYSKEIPDNLSQMSYGDDNIKSSVTVESREAIADQIHSFFSMIHNNNIENNDAKFAIEIIKTLETIELSINNNGNSCIIQD